MTAPYILVVDDEPDIHNLIREILEDEGYEVAIAENGTAARLARRARRPDLVLLDIWMPDIDGITLLKEWSDRGGLPCPVIMMSGHGTVETAVEATRFGAYDFVEKPLSLAKLLLTVERALEADKLHRESLGHRRPQPLAEPIGKSAVMQRLRDQIKRVAQHDTGVLIRGEPGAGKQTFARYLHACSPRRDGPFVEVSAGAIARENSAVGLFGSEEGELVHYGYLEQANGGTLFLDQIGDMDVETQTRLLSVLENRSFLRVGGSEPVHINVRIVAATPHDLEEKVRAATFREDLYYRLNVVPLTVPPLREHCEDVPELLNYYVNHFVDQENLTYRRFTVAAQNRLRNHVWPGNIRELANLVQRLLILGTGDEIDLDEVEAAISTQAAVPARVVHADSAYFDLPLREARERFERAYLEHQLQESGGSIGKLSKRVGMERTHLYRKLRALGIDPKQLTGDKSAE
ncbi:MAG: sigma-54-dependent Fis family transcriptional regulator [Gammaproteobacteria bacterium]|nr:sigma-54-dependent Fis family transcriptional regulator [Gammaproteobacteria bacterium]